MFKNYFDTLVEAWPHCIECRQRTSAQPCVNGYEFGINRYYFIKDNSRQASKKKCLLCIHMERRFVFGSGRLLLIFSFLKILVIDKNFNHLSAVCPGSLTITVT